VRTLANLRKNNLEFLYGDFKEVKCTEGFYAYERNYFGKKTLIVFSKNAGKVNIVKDLNRNVKAYFTHPFQLMPTEIILELKSDDFEIFTYE
jgi:hypothetical protein